MEPAHEVVASGIWFPVTKVNVTTRRDGRKMVLKGRGKRSVWSRLARVRVSQAGDFQVGRCADQ